ncbi:MAG TPA: hypothetical protein VEO54_24145 [Thermoanaerobaculia bacterium]|nr:hypothetical protein [Thermoanaerobaculia bacterium]
MSRTRTILPLLLAQWLALGAVAQSAEFGRASGGTIDAITKAPRRFSGSLTLTHSNGAARGQGYEGTLGGELLDDRAWFFASAAIAPQMQFSTPNLANLDARATAQPVDWTSATASFSRLRQPVPGTTSSSFLSLRSTSVLSDRMTLGFSFSRSNVETGVNPSLPPRP